MRSLKVLAAAAVLLASMAVAQDKGGKKGGGIQLPPMIHITIEGFADGGRIPNKYTCAGSPVSPRRRLLGRARRRLRRLMW